MKGATMRTWTFPELRATMPPDGPWVDEPDKAQWVDDATGYDCLIVRNHAGALCGYVGLPPAHPLHGAWNADAPDIQVHGGLTFADWGDEDASTAHAVCHVPEPGRPDDVWWLGFDCMHAGDASPATDRALARLTPPIRLRDQTYRTFGYVRAEVEHLARQLHAVTAGPAGG
jgi:hypothetical protein